MTLAQGEMLGQYQIQRLLGSGGMGQVYLARDTTLDRDVAIKTLLASHTENAELVKRFEIEAKSVAKFKHPKIVQVYGVNISGPQPYMAMEYVEGMTLDDLIKQNGPLNWKQALNIIAQVASALNAAHEQGVIHRDIKPANILVDKNMNVHVTDFGIAKVLADTQHLTSTDAALGSPSYMSPEHCGVGDVSPASDMFSLGVTLYECMTGELPFRAEHALAVMHKIVNDQHDTIEEKIDDVPPMVPMIVDALLEKKQDNRYTSAKQLLEDLRSIREGKEPTHLTMLRKKVAGSDTTHYELAEISSDLLAATKDQSLVTGLMDGLDTTPPPVLIRQTRPSTASDSDSGWTRIVLGGAVVLLVVLSILGIAAVSRDTGNDLDPDGDRLVPPPAQAERLPEAQERFPVMIGEMGYSHEGERVHVDAYYDPDSLRLLDREAILAKGLAFPPTFLPQHDHLRNQRPQPGGTRSGGSGGTHPRGEQ